MRIKTNKDPNNFLLHISGFNLIMSQMSQEVCNQMKKISLWVQISNRILSYIIHFQLIALYLYCNANTFLFFIVHEILRETDNNLQ